MNNNQENQDITNIYIEETLIKRLKQINSELKLDLDLELDINLSDNQIKSFIKYLKLLQKWNKAYNLTAIDKTLDIIEYHFIDCLQIAPYLSKYKNILDVGTGAGFPGIVLAIYNLDQNILLLDKSQKKIQFLKLVCHELGLNIKNNRALCVAPTGFGKTILVYQLINKKKYGIIIIFTPRRILNGQSSSNKYTKKLDNKYNNDTRISWRVNYCKILTPDELKTEMSLDASS